VLANWPLVSHIIDMSSLEMGMPAGVELDTLEPIFEDLTPMRTDIDLVRAVVWATDRIKAARIIRVSPLRLIRGEAGGWDAEELPRPITYNASLGVPHRLGGLTVFNATWIAGPEEDSAHYLQRGEFFQHYNAVDAESLTTPEDIFEAYDNNMRSQYVGHTAAIGSKDSISPNIFSADGMKLLAAAAPKP
jgi:hypothetical protein